MATEPTPNPKFVFIKMAVEAMLKDATAGVRAEVAALLRKLADQVSSDKATS